ncbi:MAG TPA: hypothetical protein PLX35_10210 [Cyclobacteriaceae bacterium]|nr:hypothetical protein [Cyclobacteriaceae bacterium]
MTRKSITLLLLILATGPLLAQNNKDSVETVFQFPHINTLGFRVSPELQAGNLSGKYAMFYGASAMITLNRTLSVGVAGFTTGRGPSGQRFSTPNRDNLTVHYGGLRVEYALNPQKKFHLTFPFLVGLGMARTDTTTSIQPDPFMRGRFDRPASGNSRSFLVIQPGVNAEINLFPHLNLFAGVSYRIVGDAGHNRINLPTVDSPTLGQLQGLTLSAGLRLRFDFNVRRKNSQ